MICDKKTLQREIHKQCRNLLEERNAYRNTCKDLEHQNTQLREANKKHKETIKKLQEIHRATHPAGAKNVIIEEET